MFTHKRQLDPGHIDTGKLGQWLQEHSISRAEMAQALGVQTTVIHNWFARQRIPRNAQTSLKHLMNEALSTELHSQIAVRLSNAMLDEVAKRAVQEGVSLETWLVQAISDKLHN